MIKYSAPNKIKEKLYPILGSLLPLGIFSKIKFYGGASLLSWYHFLSKSQWFSKVDIEVYQKSRFLDIINHCFNNIPYYQDHFKKAGIKQGAIRQLDDIALLPIINKDILKSHMNEFIANNSDEYFPVKCHTGGSTGKPLVFYLDKKLRGLMGALGMRFQNWSGQKLTDRYIMMRSQIGYREAKFDNNTPYKYDPMARMLEINTANLGIDHIKNAISLIREFNPSYLHTYPSVANHLAQYIINNSVEQIKLRGILVGSELLYEHMRENIENAFMCKVYNFYGQEEAVTFAMECENGKLHVCPELGILEIIKNGKPCKPGELGEFVCTGIQNYSMPLVRYATDDYGYYSNEKCNCGRQSPIIVIVGGRNKDLLVTRTGIVNIVSHENISKNIFGIKEFQIVQHDIDNLSVKIVRDFNYSDRDKQEMEKGLKFLLGQQTNICFEFLNNIPRTSAGKFKVVLSNVTINY